MNKVLFEQSETAKKFVNYKLPRYDELTPFPVVMRQLLCILDEHLSVFSIPGDEKVLTQSMINSYVYKRVIRAPENKEYDRRQIIHLLCIGILKQVISISDIAKLIEMQTNQYPIDIAYNYFCDELENALKVTFGSRSFSELENKKLTVKTPLTENARSAVIAFVNKVYVKQSIYFAEN